MHGRATRGQEPVWSALKRGRKDRLHEHDAKDRVSVPSRPRHDRRIEPVGDVDFVGRAARAPALATDRAIVRLQMRRPEARYCRPVSSMLV
jgi:hypothetical protein